MREKVQGIRRIIGRHKIDVEVKKSIGNGEAKELICMTHGHEQWRGRCRWVERCRVEGNKGRKNGTTVIA